jgi:hypothetical protein
MLQENYIDKDKDGKFDERRTFDMLGELLNTIPLK